MWVSYCAFGRIRTFKDEYESFDLHQDQRLGLRCRFAFGLLVRSPGKPRGDWPQFRGPDRNGISPETKLPLTWSADKNIKWKVPLPAAGNSSPIVSGTGSSSPVPRTPGPQAQPLLLQPGGRQATVGEDRRLPSQGADASPQPVLRVHTGRRRETHRRLARVGRRPLLRLRRQGTLVARPRHLPAHLGLSHRRFCTAIRSCSTAVPGPTASWFH